MDVLNAPAIPSTSISPTHDRIAILEPLRYPSITELAQPMLRLGGLRINPNTNGQHRQPYFVKLTIKNIADGREIPVNFPDGVQLILPSWSADGKYIAVGNTTPTGVELWIIDTKTDKARSLKTVISQTVDKIVNGTHQQVVQKVIVPIHVNTAFGGYDWMPDQRSLLVNLVPKNR